MRYRLRTLLIVLALVPPLLALGWWEYSARRLAQQQRETIRLRLTIDGAMPPPQLLRTGK
jgi:hypothetical protein